MTAIAFVNFYNIGFYIRMLFGVCMCIFLLSFFFIKLKKLGFWGCYSLSLSVYVHVRFIYIYIYLSTIGVFQNECSLRVCCFYLILLLPRLFAQYIQQTVNHLQNIHVIFACRSAWKIHRLFLYGRILVVRVTYIIIPVARWSSKRISFII